MRSTERRPQCRPVPTWAKAMKEVLPGMWFHTRSRTMHISRSHLCEFAEVPYNAVNALRAERAALRSLIETFGAGAAELTRHIERH